MIHSLWGKGNIQADKPEAESKDSGKIQGACPWTLSFMPEARPSLCRETSYHPSFFFLLLLNLKKKNFFFLIMARNPNVPTLSFVKQKQSSLIKTVNALLIFSYLPA